MPSQFRDLVARTTTFLRSPYGVIALCALIAHGLLLLNDGIYWDGWLVYSFIQARDWSALYAMFYGTGGPPVSYFILGLAQVVSGGVFGYKLLAFLSITGSACLVYAISRETHQLDPLEGMLIALIAMVYPAYQVSVEEITLVYLVLYFFFLLAAFATLRFETTVRPRRWVWRVGALALFTLSFRIYSLLVFYYGFLALWFIYMRSTRKLTLTNAVRLLPRRMDFLLLPLVYWGVSGFLFPQHGEYVGENTIAFTAASLQASYSGFFFAAILQQAVLALQLLLQHWGLMVLTGVVILGVFGLSSRSSAESLFADRPRVYSLGLLAVGVFLLFVGIFPYAAVGKVPLTQGWETRNALLVGLPLGITIVGGMRLIFASRRPVLQRIGVAMLATLIWVFSLSTINYYVGWQARWVKDRSIIFKLPQVLGAQKYSVYWVDDEFPLGGEGNYRYYEWASIFKQVWGGESRIGLQDVQPEFLTKGRSAFTHDSNLADFDPAGCQASLFIQPGSPTVSPAKLALKYLWLKFFQPSRLEAFLQTVTQINVAAAASPLAVDCHAP